MFSFLKDKLKKVVADIKNKVEKEAVEEKTNVEEVKKDIKKRVEEETKEKKGIFSIFKKKKEEVKEKKIKEHKEKLKKKIVEEKIKEELKVKEKQPLLEKDVGKKIKKEELKITKKVEEIRKPGEEEQILEKAEPKIIEEEIKKEVEKEEKKLGIFGRFKERVITKRITEDKFNELFVELELVLLENNVAFEVVEKLKDDLKRSLVDKPILRKEIGDIIERSLKNSLRGILTAENGIDLIKKIKESEKPFVILLLGYNGSGKTLSCARLAYYLKGKGFKPLLSAADTFRAAGAIQLEELAKKAKIPVIVGQTGADSCALIFDSIKSAKARNYDVVIADTAGRIQSNKDLMRELEKIARVNKPHLKLLVIDALSGTDVVEQAKQFDSVVGVDGFIITKVDVYERGGAVLNASYITKKPIFFIGTGQRLDSLKEYSADEVLINLGFD